MAKKMDVVGHIRCGFHSGFRLCCVLWFVLVWNWIWSSKFFKSFVDKYRKQRARFDDFHIACPLCIWVWGVKKLKPIQCNCPRYKSSRQMERIELMRIK